MSIAGWVGEASGASSEAVRTSLHRLSYDSSAPVTVVRGDGFLLGAVNDSSVWRDEVSGVTCAWSGSMYHAAATASEAGAAQDASPAEIAARAYLRWGADFPGHIYGEYALAVWDASVRRMLLVRDGMARVPAYYAAVKDGYAFASEVRGLRGWPGVDGQIDDVAVARLFSLAFEEGMTLYRGIRSFSGGTILTLEQGKQTTQRRYWDPLSRPQLHLKDWREYAVAIREAMIAAVAVRLPQQGLVAAQMSSGFDSSGVAALAAEALGRQNRPLLCYTSVPARETRPREILQDRFGDEWPLAAKVAALYPNMEHIAIPSNYGSLWESLDTLSDGSESPSGFIRNSRWYYGILREAQKRGAVTMLEGQAGNLTSSYTGSFGLYDLRRRGHWLPMVQAAVKRHRHGMAWKTIAQAIVMPGQKTSRWINWLRRKPVPRMTDLSLMREDFYRNSGLQVMEHSQMGQTIEGDRRNGATWRFSILSKVDLGMARAMQQRQFGLQREDPTADSRLVELVLSIPDEAFAPDGIRRELYREALRNHLPAELLSEPMRGLQSGDFLHHFEEDLPAVYEELQRLEETESVQRYIDLSRMRGMLDTFNERKASNRSAADMTFNYTVGGALAFGRFLRRLEKPHAQR